MRRRPPALLAAILAGALLTGCSFSSGSTTEVTETGGEAGTAGAAGEALNRKPAQPTPSGPHVSALCDSLTAVYLSNISDAESAAGIVNDWVRVTASAPRSLKKDLNVVGAYLVAAAKGDLATVKAASTMVGDALDNVDRYVTRVCKA